MARCTTIPEILAELESEIKKREQYRDEIKAMEHGYGKQTIISLLFFIDGIYGQLQEIWTNNYADKEKI